ARQRCSVPAGMSTQYRACSPTCQTGLSPVRLRGCSTSSADEAEADAIDVDMGGSERFDQCAQFVFFRSRQIHQGRAHRAGRMADDARAGLDDAHSITLLAVAD